MATKTHAGVIDMTPTWSDILPSLLAVMTEGMSMESRQFARAELERMAQIADKYVASQKRK